MRFAIALAAAALLALPAQALADSAGDQQYQDPFANSAPAPSKQKSSGQVSGNTQSSSPSTSSSASVSSSAAATAPVAHAATSGQLPRTGIDARLVAVLGTALIGGGLLLRRLA